MFMQIAKNLSPKNLENTSNFEGWGLTLVAYKKVHVIQSRISQILVKNMHTLFSYKGMLITSSTLQRSHYLPPIIKNYYDYRNCLLFYLCTIILLLYVPMFSYPFKAYT